MHQRRRDVGFLLRASYVILAVVLSSAMYAARKYDLSSSCCYSFSIGRRNSGANFAVNTIRFPRMLAGLFAGFAFGVGRLYFSNDVTKSISKSKYFRDYIWLKCCGSILYYCIHTSNTTVSIAAVIGGLATVIVMYLLARRGIIFHWSYNHYWHCVFKLC